MLNVVVYMRRSNYMQNSYDKVSTSLEQVCKVIYTAMKKEGTSTIHSEKAG